MKTSSFKRLFCLWLALQVLVSGIGVGVVEHWCLMRGYSKTTLLSQQVCKRTCQPNDPTALPTNSPSVKRGGCCKTTLTYQHIDVSNAQVDQLAQTAPILAVFPVNLAYHFLPIRSLHANVWVATRPVAHDPLHQTGRFRLASHCTWLI